MKIFVNTLVYLVLLLATISPVGAANPPGSKGFKLQAKTSDTRFNGLWVTYFQKTYDRNYNKSASSPNAPLVMQPQLGIGWLVQFAGSNDNELIMSNVNYTVDIFAWDSDTSVPSVPSGPGYNYIQAGAITGTAGSPFTPTTNLNDKAGFLVWNSTSWATWAVCVVNGIKGFTTKQEKQLLWRKKGGKMNTTACADVQLKLVPYTT